MNKQFTLLWLFLCAFVYAAFAAAGCAFYWSLDGLNMANWVPPIRAIYAVSVFILLIICSKANYLDSKVNKQ